MIFLSDSILFLHTDQFLLLVIIIKRQDIRMQFEEAGGENNNNDGDEIEDVFENLGLQEKGQIETHKNDSVIFIIDVSKDMLTPHEGQQHSQLQKILKGFVDFMMSKIIANASDRVGLILCNVKNTSNSLNFENINTVFPIAPPSAMTIKQANEIVKNFEDIYGLSQNKANLHQAFWLYNHQVKDIDPNKYHLRLFFFTSDDCPYPVGQDKRDQTINHARQLADKNVYIELFPVKRAKRCNFDMKKFYNQVITFDADDINETIADSSSKIMDLQSRLKQKQYKKRTLNRLLMKIGENQKVGVKIYSTFNKARKPLGKKIDAKTNKKLERVTRKMNPQGEILFEGQIGTYYPLGNEKVIMNKEDMNKIKNLESPGITLIGFKPKSYIKPYHNLRSSYFLYPDEQHVAGSSQFIDALITQLTVKNMVGIVKIVPRANQQLRFAALLPQQQKYDEEDHFQTPPGFNLIFLPFADDIANFSGEKTIVQPATVSSQLVQITKLLVNNLTIHDFDFRNFQNPGLQKFYSHLQAHALGQTQVNERADLLMPDYQGMSKFQDVIDLVKETANADLSLPIKKQQEGMDEQLQCQYQFQKKQVKQEPKKRTTKSKEVKQEPVKKSRTKASKKQSAKQKEVKQQIMQDQQDNQLVGYVQGLIMEGQMKSLKVTQLRNYLKVFNLDSTGKKEELLDRIMTFIACKNSI